MKILFHKDGKLTEDDVIESKYDKGSGKLTKGTTCAVTTHYRNGTQKTEHYINNDRR